MLAPARERWRKQASPSRHADRKAGRRRPAFSPTRRAPHAPVCDTRTRSAQGGGLGGAQASPLLILARTRRLSVALARTRVPSFSSSDRPCSPAFAAALSPSRTHSRRTLPLSRPSPTGKAGRHSADRPPRRQEGGHHQGRRRRRGLPHVRPRPGRRPRPPAPQGHQEVVRGQAGQGVQAAHLHQGRQLPGAMEEKERERGGEGGSGRFLRASSAACDLSAPPARAPRVPQPPSRSRARPRPDLTPPLLLPRSLAHST